MPPPGVPPTPYLPSSVFDALHAMDYDANLGAFKDSKGTRYYLFACKKSGGSYDQSEWCYDTDSDGGAYPRGKVSQTTFDVFKYGSYDSQNNAITYLSQSYRVRQARDGNDNGLAEAYVW